MTLVSLSVGISLPNSLSVKSGIRKLNSKLSKYEKRGAEISLQQALERVAGISGGTVCQVSILCSGKSAIIIACIGYHVPAVRRRDRFYAKLEDERLERASA